MTGNHHIQNTSDSFDHDFGTSHDVVHHHGSHQLIQADHVSHSLTGSSYEHGNDIFHYQDPLKYSSQHQFHALQLDMDMGNTHFVQPHQVNSYVRSDGSVVKEYYRDGDGNTAIDHTLSQGGGYTSTNPDGNPFNNLK